MAATMTATETDRSPLKCRPRITWGTQEPLWPVTPAAMSACATKRLEVLASPKPNFQTDNMITRPEFAYSCGRSSMIWEVSPAATRTPCTERLEKLASSKKPPEQFIEDRPHYVFSCGRSSPIWKVRHRFCGEPSQRVENLAQSKPLHKEFRPCRMVQTIIPHPALRATPNQRMEALSTPKDRSAGPFRDPIWPVSGAAKKSGPSPRCMELSEPKGIPEGYLLARNDVCHVSRSAVKAKCTERLEKLAQPNVRATMDNVQFDPNAFLVKENALKALCSARTEELARPTYR